MFLQWGLRLGREGRRSNQVISGGIVLYSSGSGPPVDKSEPTTGRGRGRARRMYSPGEKCGAHVVLCLLLRRRLRRCDCAVIIHRREGGRGAIWSCLRAVRGSSRCSAVPLTLYSYNLCSATATYHSTSFVQYFVSSRSLLIDLP